MTVPSENTKDVVAAIAQQLGETEATPLLQIRRIVKQLGAERTLEFLAETQQIEAQGGLMLPDGSRRRTPGGVFFYLVKQKLPKKQVMKIFYRQGPQQHQTQSQTKPKE
jgi:phosphorylated adapter RNA export protein